MNLMNVSKYEPFPYLNMTYVLIDLSGEIKTALYGI